MREKQKRRQHYVAIRFDDDELERLDVLRGMARRGPYLRAIVMGRRPPRPIPQPNREMYAETARWAANLNQLVRRMHQGETVEIAEIKEALKAFRRGLLGMGVTDDDSENQPRE